MTALPITSLAAALLGIIYIALIVGVVRQRAASRISLGDGSANIPFGQEAAAPKLFVAVRSHMNFVESVPLTLLLLALCEVQGAPRWLLWGMAACLVLGRVVHPLGMTRPVPNPLRGGGAALTMLVGVVGIIVLLARAFS